MTPHAALGPILLRVKWMASYRRELSVKNVNWECWGLGKLMLPQRLWGIL